MLCDLFMVYSKQSNGAVSLIQQSCMSSYNYSYCVCYNKKTKQISALKKVILKWSRDPSNKVIKAVKQVILYLWQMNRGPGIMLE